MSKIVVIKRYCDGRKKLVGEGQELEGEWWDDAARRIIREHGMRNRGEFLVITALDSGAYVTECPSGIELVGCTTIWLSRQEVAELARALGLRGEGDE